MVTSAGLDAFEPFASITAESWERILAINLTGTFHCLQAAVPDMIEARWGRMVTISSSSAQSGAPRMAHYVASKAGVIGLTKALALELAPHGITVNNVPPGMIDTPMLRRAEADGDIGKLEKLVPRMIPVGRAGTPEDIAATCAFLCSDAAGFIRPRSKAHAGIRSRPKEPGRSTSPSSTRRRFPTRTRSRPSSSRSSARPSSSAPG
jgi:NAD(P)-dependent dehydrogenase (short-subunit alcohol dehydrogenase family)